MKKYLMGVDPAVDGYRPSLISQRYIPKDEQIRFDEYFKKLKKALWSNLQIKPLNEIRKEKIEEIINRL
jgi:hypothetical protein